MKNNVRYRSQTVNYLGFLQTQLRDLRGISTLVYELIQNADDVLDDYGQPAARRITFDIRDDALIVENDGVFREVDFDRVSHIASGGKREEKGTTGAFGIGFISVYQITDCPEIFSSGQHWRIRPDAKEEERIEIRDAEAAGTRFRLPWAFDPDSEVRRKLRIEAKTITLWDVASGQRRSKPLTGHTDAMSSLIFSPDGQILASGGMDGTIRLWDVAGGYTRETLSGHTGIGMNVSFSPDGKILADSEEKIIRLWDVTNGQLRSELTGHTGNVESLAFSPDGKTLASGSMDTTIILWDFVKRQPLGKPLTGHATSVQSVAFSPDGKTLASGSVDSTIRLWDVASKQLLSEPLIGHGDAIYALTFSPDGKILASGSMDKTVRLWDVASGQPLGEPMADHEGLILSVGFSPDGKILADSGDKIIKLWDIDPASWMARACRIANRSMTIKEWKQYFSDEPYSLTCPGLPPGESAARSEVWTIQNGVNGR